MFYCHACGGKKGNTVCPFCTFNLMEEVKEFITRSPTAVVCNCKATVMGHKQERDAKTGKLIKWMRVMCDGQRVKVNGSYK